MTQREWTTVLFFCRRGNWGIEFPNLSRITQTANSTMRWITLCFQHLYKCQKQKALFLNRYTPYYLILEVIVTRGVAQSESKKVWASQPASLDEHGPVSKKSISPHVQWEKPNPEFLPETCYPSVFFCLTIWLKQVPHKQVYLPRSQLSHFLPRELYWLIFSCSDNLASKLDPFCQCQTQWTFWVLWVWISIKTSWRLLMEWKY